MYKVVINMTGKKGVARRQFSGTAHNDFNAAVKEAAEALRLFENVYIIGGELPVNVTTGAGYTIE